MSELKKYVVIKPIGYKGERLEVGQEILLSSEEAENIGSEYIKDMSEETQTPETPETSEQLPTSTPETGTEVKPTEPQTPVENNPEPQA